MPQSIFTQKRKGSKSNRRYRPELVSQAERTEYRYGVFHRETTEARGHAIAVPSPGQLPYLGERQRDAALTALYSTPFVDFSFRPEEQNRLSGVDNVIVPQAEWQGEMHQVVLAALQLGRFDLVFD